jgi:uncharacterized membrane protein
VSSPAAKGGRGLRILGHPVHAALSAFPLAFLSGSVVADGIALFRNPSFWWAASFWLVAAGLLAAAPTVGAGLADYLSAVRGERTERTATIHMLVMLTALACFGIDLLFRGGTSPPSGATLISTVALDAAGAAIVTVGGWYGGELVFGHAVGVDAHDS